MNEKEVVKQFILIMENEWQHTGELEKPAETEARGYITKGT